MNNLPNHELVDYQWQGQVNFELKPCLDRKGQKVSDLYSAWIILNNPKAFNAYSTQMLKDLQLAFHKASSSRNVVAVVLTGAGDRAFCTGGDLNHYVEDYLERPEEFRQYLKIFSDVITEILSCDKPVINRVNGMRIGGGQELGLACDLSIASDLANFGQAGTKHGSAPIIGATDFMPLYTGLENATRACALGEVWTAYQALRFNLVSKVVKVVKDQDEFIRNPLVTTDWLKDGEIVYGSMKTDDSLTQGKKKLKECQIDLSLLDKAVQREITDFLYSFPNCVSVTLENLRQHKLERWSKSKNASRSWLALNAMSEARAGFRSFVEAPSKDQRQADFIALRKKMAQGQKWNEAFVEEVLPPKVTDN